MWQPSQGKMLHHTQLKILLRALELVKVGGVVCYSTCSLNPVEDEAVIAAALRKLNRQDDREEKPTIELLEFPSLSGFTRRPGINSWKVADFSEQDMAKTNKSDNDQDDDDEVPHLRWHKTWKDAEDAGLDGALESMWPQSDLEGMNLGRCTRLWPHDHDTGGFFLALLRKNESVS